MYSVERYHDISCGHRVVGHESKCSNLHGHNYRIHFVCVPEVLYDDKPTRSDPTRLIKVTRDLDEVGRVIDFGVIKEQLCEWLERNWDHKFLMYTTDPILRYVDIDILDGVVIVPFNPTAENMAAYLVDVVGPKQLKGSGVVLQTVRIEETAKCSATFTREINS